jgi:metallo-beta-lactamase family protein
MSGPAAALTFLGAAGEVTGSCYLVDTGEVKFLVECGMFQGSGADEKNRRFGFDPRDIAFLILSHAHIDHSGLIPRLVALGFKGSIFATRATCDLLGVMLPDSGYLQEKEQDWRGATPLYTVAEAQRSLERLRPVAYGEAFQPHRSVRCVLRDAGHILGSAIVELELGGKKVVFSGDLGQPGHPLVKDTEPVARADVLLVESTYGNRDHKSLERTIAELEGALNETLAARRGNVVIPAFAVGRTQEILHFIGELQRARRLPKLEVYVDSPMALAATRITLKYAPLPDIDSVRFVEDLAESKKLDSVRAGAVILSASGMCEGGRIRHHLRANLPRAECAIVFAGFQAAGTLGRRIVDGAQTVKIFGEIHPVRARIHTLGGLSAHADQSALLAWLGRFQAPPAQTWVVHGEPLSAHAFRDTIEMRLGWRAAVPQRGQTVQL